MKIDYQITGMFFVCNLIVLYLGIIGPHHAFLVPWIFVDTAGLQTRILMRLGGML